jgi:predicted lipoprotein
MRFKAAAVIVLASALGLAGCKFVKTADKDREDQAGAFDPDKLVAEMWEAKIVPYLEKRAAPLPQVLAATLANPDEAGRKYGYKARQGNAPWTFIASIDGVIVAEETKSRAGYVDVDVDGDAKADVRVSIGPSIRGTALRDSLDFMDFNAFKNQIEWAQFGKSFNSYVNGALLEKLPREGLTGKTLKATGAYPLPAEGQLPLLVPATIAVGG